MEDPRIVAGNAIALAVTLIVLFTLRPRALRLGLVDRPSARKRHRGAVPLIGGLSFFVGTLAALLYLRQTTPFLLTLIAAASLIVIVGVVDDLKDLSVKSRLLVQGGAVAAVIAVTGVHIKTLGSVFGSPPLDLGMLGVPLTMVAVVAMINAFNMLDGIDGLAGSVALLTIVAIMAFVGPGQEAAGVSVLLQVLFTALVPYLLVNMGWPDGRKIFMGDAGSTMLGFLLAWSMIYVSQNGVGRFRPVDMAWCAALPILETPAVMFRRMRRGLSPFKPDRRHLHHMLLDIGFSPRRTLAIIVGATAGLMLVGYLLRGVDAGVSLAIFVVLGGLYMFATRESLAWLPGRPRAAGRARQAIGVDDAPGRADASAQAGPAARLRVLCLVENQQDAILMGSLGREMREDGRFDILNCVVSHGRHDLDRLLPLLGSEAEILVEVSPAEQQADGGREAVLRRVRQILRELGPDLVLLRAGAGLCDAITGVAHQGRVTVAQIRVPAPQVLAIGAGRRVKRAMLSLRLIGIEDAWTPAADAASAPSSGGESGFGSRGVVSTLDYALERLSDEPALRTELKNKFHGIRDMRPYLLVVDVDRARRASVTQALVEVARRYRDLSIFWLDATQQESGAAALPALPNLHMIRSQDYLEYAYLLGSAYLVVTDSESVRLDAEHLARAALLVSDLFPDARLDAGAAGAVAPPADIDGAQAIAGNIMVLLSNAYVHDAVSHAGRPMADDDDTRDQVIAALAALPRMEASGDGWHSAKGAGRLTRAA